MWLVGRRRHQATGDPGERGRLLRRRWGDAHHPIPRDGVKETEMVLRIVAAILTLVVTAFFYLPPLLFWLRDRKPKKKASRQFGLFR